MEIIQTYGADIVNTIIATGFGGFFGWFWTRKQQKAAVTTTEIENGAKVIDLYKEALDDLPHRYESKFTGLNELFEQKEKILKEEIDFLKKERDLWKRKYNDLLREHRQYKRDHP